MPSSMPTTDNPIASFFEEITYKDPKSDFDAEDIAEALDEAIGAVTRVEDASDAGWLVPRGESVVVTTERGKFLVTVRAVS